MPTFSSVFDTVEQKIDALFADLSFYVLAFLALLLIGSLCRFLFGKRGQIAKALLSAAEIVCLYALFFACERFGLRGQLFVRALPFLCVDEGRITLLSVLGTPFSELCAHILRLLLLAFAVNLLHTVIPTGKATLTRLFLRAASIVLVLAANYFLDVALEAWLPQGFGRYAPVLLLAALALLVFMGSLRFFVGAALLSVNPLLAALYTFFFSNFIGRALARAMLSTALLTAGAYLVNVLAS